MNTGKPTLGMGILSWRGGVSLDYALQSYQAEGLFSLFDESVIVLPEPDDLIKKTVAKYPLQAHEFKDNLGIAGGMRAVAEALSTDYVLFLENDCPLVESYNTAQRQLALIIEVLEAKHAFMARLRSRRDPGEPFFAPPKYYRYWGDGIMPSLRRTLRPNKAVRLCSTSVYETVNPHHRHPKYIQQHSPEHYIVSPIAMPWSNQSVILRRHDFLNVILPFVESQPLKRTVNGFRNIEIELNRTKFWTKSDYKTFCPPGLFSHLRLEDRGYI